mgnify:CR=1 FL=1
MIVLALLLSPMSLMLESSPSELERANPKSLTVCSPPSFDGVYAADDDYGVGETVAIRVDWCTAVYVTGTPRLVLSNAVETDYSYGSGTPALWFSYTVAEGDTSSADLSVSSLELNGGTIQDSNGTGANTGVNGDLGSVTVDGDAPDFVGVSATDGEYYVDDSVLITVTFDEAVVFPSGSSDPSLSLSNGGTAAYDGGQGTTALTFNYTVSPVDSSTSDLEVLSYSGTIQDAAGGFAGQVSGDLGAVSINSSSDQPLITSVISSWGDWLNLDESEDDGWIIASTQNLEGSVATFSVGDGLGTDWSNQCTVDSLGSCSVDVPEATLQALLEGTNQIWFNASNATGVSASSTTSFVKDVTLPELAIVSIWSDNGIDTATAEVGDIVTLYMFASEEVSWQSEIIFFANQGVISSNNYPNTLSGVNAYEEWILTLAIQDGWTGEIGFIMDSNIYDEAGNEMLQSVDSTTDGSSVTILFDAPMMTISAAEVAPGSSSDDQSLSLTFASNQATTNFAVSDITVSNAAISNFAATAATVYTATLTPAGIGWVTVDIAAGSFTSSSTGETNIVSPQFIWEYRPDGPQMIVSSDELSDGAVTSSDSVDLTFTSSAATSDFTESDIYENHCVISDFTAVTEVTYTATCTAQSDGSSSISVIGGVFSDQGGTANYPSNTFTWTYDGTGPSITITSTEVNSGDTSGDPEIWLTFASNEPTTDFDAGDINVTNGVLSSFTPLIATQYMAMLTPLTMGEETIVEVGSGTYHDAVGNSNTGAQFVWTYLDLDSDSDGVSDYYDTDDDDDGVPDSLDDLPLDPSDYVDTDGDGVGNSADDDDDGDLWDDSTEILCESEPLDILSFPLDTDYDGTCDIFDDDDDNDGVADSEDTFPLLWGESEDSDGDGIGNNADSDDDDDGVSDSDELACLSDSLDGNSLPVDTDGDGICDPMDADSDGDGHPDSNDAFPSDQTQWEDNDNDGLGDNPNGLNPDPHPNDRDNDGYPDSSDPFPLISTPGDMDDDGYSDSIDIFPANPNEWLDFDGDGIGDNSDPDDDGDGYSDIVELREGSLPFDANSVPVEGFEIVLPGTWGGEKVALGAWDLLSLFGGGPIVLWLAFSFTTRKSRSANVESAMREARTREELNDIAERTEYLLMLRLLGVHQGIKLERIRAELDDVIEAREGTEFGDLDQTPEVEVEMRHDRNTRVADINDLDSLADDLIDE